MLFLCLIPTARQAGASLLELLVSIAVASMLMLSGSAMMIYMFKKHSEQFRSAHLYAEIYPVLGIISDRIAMAGYWSSASEGEPYSFSAPGPANPFTEAGWDLETQESNQCLLFSYDLNRDGVATSDERIGYRLSGNALEEGRQATDCSSGQWAALTDRKAVKITSLTFAISSQAIGAFIRRSVTIRLVGEPVSVTGSSQSLQRTVRIANDKAS